MAKQYRFLWLLQILQHLMLQFLSSVLLLPQLNIPIRGKIKITLMFSFYVLDLINFDKGAASLTLRC
jgi:hypothetical protein